MSNSKLKPLDKTFLHRLKPGDRLFHYPKRDTPETSFSQSPPTDQTLYSVIDLPSAGEVVLLKVFDTSEQKHNFSHDQLLSGDWWYQ